MRQPAIIWSAIHAKFGSISVWRRRTIFVVITCLGPFLAGSVGAARFYGTLEITINRCAFHPPEEPPENAAFITVRDRGYDGLAPKQVFSGWIFSSSPAISALEHPVYDLTLLACLAD